MAIPTEQQFTRYEIARIIGARALQIAMDAPLLLKISEADLKLMKYDALRIAEKELREGVLPISISRPTPKRQKEKISSLKSEVVSDEELIAKEAEVEKEIVEGADQLGFVNEGEDDDTELAESDSASEEQ